jgi:hypothetical protein
MFRWWPRGVLVALSFAFGLLQGSRAALGDAPLPAEPATQVEPGPESPEVGAGERDPLRGRFFRPARSNALRPLPRLHQSRWTPIPAPRLAQSCADPRC